MLALEFGRWLMEAGARARSVEEITVQVAVGLGVERTDVLVGYASLAITIGIGPGGITRKRKVGALGVNQSLDHALRTAAARIERGGFTATEAQAELDRLVRAPRRHPDWVVAVAVGVACAAFGRLLGVDWAGVAPIFAAAALGQMVRRQLALRNVNVFVSVTVVAFLGSTLSGLGGRWTGSGHEHDSSRVVIGVGCAFAERPERHPRWPPDPGQRPGGLGGGDPGIHHRRRLVRPRPAGEAR